MPDLQIFFGFSGFAIVVLILGVVIVLKGVVTVTQGFEYTVERFGRYTKTLRPGFHVIVPICGLDDALSTHV